MAGETEKWHNLLTTSCYLISIKILTKYNKDLKVLIICLHILCVTYSMLKPAHFPYANTCLTMLDYSLWGTWTSLFLMNQLQKNVCGSFAEILEPCIYYDFKC